MVIFLKATAGVLISVVLCLAISKHGNDFSLLLTLAVCCMLTATAVSYLTPVYEFFYELQSIGRLNNEMLGILLKSVGIGLLAEIAGMICIDAGNAAMAKALRLLAGAIILCMSIPMFRCLLDLTEEILGST